MAPESVFDAVDGFLPSGSQTPPALGTSRRRWWEPSTHAAPGALPCAGRPSVHNAGAALDAPPFAPGVPSHA